MSGSSSRSRSGLRDEVLAGTARLRQQLLEAVDKLQQSINDYDEVQVSLSHRIIVICYCLLKGAWLNRATCRCGPLVRYVQSMVLYSVIIIIIIGNKY